MPVGPPPTTTCRQGEERQGRGEWIYHVEQTTLFFLAGTRERGGLNAVEEASLHLRLGERGGYMHVKHGPVLRLKSPS